MTTQRHPLFAHLLRPLVEGHYQVETNLPVGDLPREADLVLLRRTAAAAGAFRGIWRHLTTWNVLEFKGPTVSARVADVDLLVELGLGIDRKLNEQRGQQRQPEVERGEVSFWYLANHLGSRFLRDVHDLVGELTELDPGIWRVRLLGRWLVLVSNQEVPVDRDSVPIHLLVREPVDTTRAVAQTVAREADLLQLYGGWLASMFPELWEELQRMAQQTGTEPVINLLPVIEKMGLERVIQQIGPDRVIQQIGMERMIQLAGVEKVIQYVGLGRFLQCTPPEMLGAHMTPEYRNRLRQFWEQEGQPEPSNGDTPPAGAQ